MKRARQRRKTAVRWAVRFAPLASVLVLGLVWQAAAMASDPRFLPSTAMVAAALWKEAWSGDLAFHLGMTLWRVAAAFAISMAVGSAIGLWLGRSAAADRWFGPWVLIFLNIPALVVIVLAYIWFGLTEAAAIGAVAVNKIPNVVVTVREGARALDPKFDELAQIYRFTWRDRLSEVLSPQLQPFFAAAARSGVSLIWKIVLVVELLGRSNGVGFQIHLAFQQFDVAAILAYTLAFVAVMLAVEIFALQPFERRARRWRGAHA